MMANSTRIATRVSCFCVIAATALLAVAGCDDTDCCSGSGRTTSLVGTYACGTGECQTGEICTTFTAGIDSGVAPSPYCTQVPAPCTIEDCAYNDCAPCVRELCGAGSDWTSLRVDGRELSCYGY